MNENKVYDAYVSWDSIRAFGEATVYKTIEGESIYVTEVCERNKKPTSRWKDLCFVGLVTEKGYVRSIKTIQGL